MLTLVVNAEGKTFGDLALALDEVVRAINDTCWSGMNGNDDGEYTFDVTGDEEESDDEEDEDEEDEEEE